MVPLSFGNCACLVDKVQGGSKVREGVGLPQMMSGYDLPSGNLCLQFVERFSL